MKNKFSFRDLVTIIAFAIVGILISSSIPVKTNASSNEDAFIKDCERNLVVDIYGIDNIPSWCDGTVSITYTIYGVPEMKSQPFVQGQSRYTFGVSAGIRGTVTPGIAWDCPNECILTKVSKNYLSMPCGTYYGHEITITCDEE